MFFILNQFVFLIAIEVTWRDVKSYGQIYNNIYFSKYIALSYAYPLLLNIPTTTAAGAGDKNMKINRRVCNKLGYGRGKYSA